MLENLDFIGPQITLTIKNNYKFKSKKGAFNSILLFLLCMGAFV